MDYFVFCGKNWDYYFCRKNRDSELEHLEDVVLTTEYDAKKFIDSNYDTPGVFLQYASCYNFFSKLYYISEADYNEFSRNTGKKVNPEKVVMIGGDGRYYLSDCTDTDENKCGMIENVKIISVIKSKQPREYIDFNYFNSKSFLVYA